MVLHGRSHTKNMTIHPRVPTGGRGEGGGGDGWGQVGTGGGFTHYHELFFCPRFPISFG